MGAWGVGNFDNDASRDWLGDLLDLGDTKAEFEFM